jgi:DNA-binding MarR family transcriptional regulator
MYIHLFIVKEKASRIPELPCACASLRRAARALTLPYEAVLRPFGLHITQFTILQTLARTGEVLQGKLGRILALDSTTLTRTLRIMVREGWIAERRGTDRRERLIGLAEAGRKLLEAATPRWEKTQEELSHRFGDRRWSDLFTITNELTLLTTQGGETS